MSKSFKTITAKEQEIPIKTLDKKINCFGVINDCAKAIMLSSLLKYFFSILFVKVRVNYKFSMIMFNLNRNL